MDADEGRGGPDLAFSPIVVIQVDIDIKPGCEVNVVNPMSRGVVPVAILASEHFDVAPRMALEEVTCTRSNRR